MAPSRITVPASPHGRVPHEDDPSTLQHIGDPGIIVFGKSMRVTYVNERARILSDCVRDSRSAVPLQNDLMCRIVKSVARVREQLNDKPWADHQTEITDEFTVSTDSGLFRILAFPIPQGKVADQSRVMVMLYRCQRVRPIPGALTDSRHLDQPLARAEDRGSLADASSQPEVQAW